MPTCQTCQKDVIHYCYDQVGAIICADCIRSKGFDGDHSEYCAQCGRYLGQTSIKGKEIVIPAFYLHIQSIFGSGIGTICICADCINHVPDRMQYYHEKIRDNIMRFYEKKETN